MSIIPFPPKRLLPGIVPVTPRVKALDEMKSIFDRTPPRPAAVPLSPSPTLPLLTILSRGNAALQRMSGFIGSRQLAIVKDFLRGEEGQWFMEKMESLATLIENMPKTYEQDGKGDDAICYLHYFGGSYDGYITEKDMTIPDDPSEAQWQASGFVRWAHMPDDAECGYICLPEIFQSHMELDLHFTPTRLGDIKARFNTSHESHPSHTTDEPTPLPKPPDNAPAEPIAGQLHIRIERAEGYEEECTTHHYADFATAWACLQAHGHTAPDNGCYDKTDITVTFPDGQQWAYRHDMTRGGSADGNGLDLASNILQSLRFYTGERTPEWMIRDKVPHPYADTPNPRAVRLLDTWGHLLDPTQARPSPEPPPSSPPLPPSPTRPDEVGATLPSSSLDSIKRKLAKLLKLGEDAAATDGEITNALAIATRLMAEHQLTRDDIDLTAADPAARLALGRHFAFGKSRKLTTWELQLSSFVSAFIGGVNDYCTAPMPVRRNGIADPTGSTASAIAFYGADDAARCAVEMFEELRDAIATMAIVRWGGWAKGDGAKYALGFAMGLIKAHEQATATLDQDPATHAMILRNSQTSLAIVKQARHWLSATHGVNLKPAKSRSVSIRGTGIAAYGEGKRDGANYKATRPTSHRKLN